MSDSRYAEMHLIPKRLYEKLVDNISDGEKKILEKISSLHGDGGRSMDNRTYHPPPPPPSNGHPPPPPDSPNPPSSRPSTHRRPSTSHDSGDEDAPGPPPAPTAAVPPLTADGNSNDNNNNTQPEVNETVNVETVPLATAIIQNNDTALPDTQNVTGRPGNIPTENEHRIYGELLKAQQARKISEEKYDRLRTQGMSDQHRLINESRQSASMREGEYNDAVGRLRMQTEHDTGERERAYARNLDVVRDQSRLLLDARERAHQDTYNTLIGEGERAISKQLDIQNKDSLKYSKLRRKYLKKKKDSSNMPPPPPPPPPPGISSVQPAPQPVLLSQTQAVPALQAPPRLTARVQARRIPQASVPAARVLARRIPQASVPARRIPPPPPPVRLSRRRHGGSLNTPSRPDLPGRQNMGESTSAQGAIPKRRRGAHATVPGVIPHLMGNVLSTIPENVSVSTRIRNIEEGINNTPRPSAPPMPTHDAYKSYTDSIRGLTPSNIDGALSNISRHNANILRRYNDRGVQNSVSKNSASSLKKYEAPQKQVLPQVFHYPVKPRKAAKRKRADSDDGYSWVLPDLKKRKKKGE